MPTPLGGKFLAALLRVLQEERDIPGDWFLSAFKATPGRIPQWAEEKLRKFQDDRYNERNHLSSDKGHFETKPTQSNAQFLYDVAISFAGEDRAHASDLAGRLVAKGVRVFYDDYEQADLWGKDLYQHLQKVYRDTARFCVILISAAYSKKLWTRHELKQAQARAFADNSEYILPLKLDETDIPGINPTVGYVSLKDHDMDSIARLIVNKIGVSGI